MSSCLASVATVALSLVAVLATAQHSPPEGGPHTPVEEAPVEGIDEEVLDRARQIAADRHGIDLEQTVALHGARVELPALELGLFSVKVDVIPAKVTEIVAIGEDLKELDFEELHQRELDVWDEQHGRVDTALAGRLARAGEDEEVPVVLWLRLPARTPLDKPLPEEPITDEELDALLQRALAVQQSDVAGVVPTVVDRLQSVGVEDVVGGKTAPWAGGTLRVSLIYEVAKWEEVERIYLSVPIEQSLGVARRAVGADLVHQRGIYGRPPGMPGGLPLGVIEAGGGRIRSSRVVNPLLSGVVQDLQNACGDVNAHAMAVASIIRSSDPVLRGIAYGASLRVGGDCQGRPAAIMQKTEDFIRGGVHALNYSFGHSARRPRGPAGNRR